jgi:hypothetical protein
VRSLPCCYWPVQRAMTYRGSSCSTSARNAAARPPRTAVTARPALRLAAWRAVWAAMPNIPVMAARVHPPHHPPGQPADPITFAVSARTPLVQSLGPRPAAKALSRHRQMFAMPVSLDRTVVARLLSTTALTSPANGNSHRSISPLRRRNLP